MRGVRAARGERPRARPGGRRVAAELPRAIGRHAEVGARDRRSPTISVAVQTAAQLGFANLRRGYGVTRLRIAGARACPMAAPLDAIVRRRDRRAIGRGAAAESSLAHVRNAGGIRRTVTVGHTRRFALVRVGARVPVADEVVGGVAMMRPACLSVADLPVPTFAAAAWRVARVERHTRAVVRGQALLVVVAIRVALAREIPIVAGEQEAASGKQRAQRGDGPRGAFHQKSPSK